MTPRPARPCCFLNVAMSLDGKIASFAREMPTFPSRADRRLMDEVRARADAVLIGAGTLRAADYPLRIRSGTLRRKRRSTGRPEQPLNILLSNSLRLPLAGRFFAADDIQRIIVTSRSASTHRIRQVSSRARVILLGERRVDPRRLMGRLVRLGIKSLLLEGGGETNFSFLDRGLVDEIYLTLCPVIVGGSASPTPVDGPGFLPARYPWFRLDGVRRKGDELFLHYYRTR
jgi:5-amino-6-(5-phosphoribosylamino)uracil reductase